MTDTELPPTRWDEVHTRLGAIRRGADDGLPLGNKPDPYDELVYILLTVMTRSQPRIDRAFAALRELSGGEWSGLLDVPVDEVREVLVPLGFVNRRTSQLLGAIRRVTEEHGGSLDFLASLTDEQALEFLVTFPGVGEKTAKCVMMYSLGRDVFPVDIHVLRVAKRLGLVARDVPWARAARELEESIPARLKFGLHVGLVIHGRDVCKGPNPLCDECVLLDLCQVGAAAERVRSAYV